MSEPNQLQPNQRELVPVPDPTEKTTEVLLREIANSREIIESKIHVSDAAIDGIRRVFETRLGAMDRALELLQASADRAPALQNASIRTLQDLHEEKFRSIQTQFMERDTRTTQSSEQSSLALTNALNAAKEAVGEQNKSNALSIAKSEATFTKQIDQIIILISTMQKGLDDKIDDMKTRIQAIESVKKGGVEIWGVLVVVVVVGLMITVAAAAFMRH